jgi:hypothetical protein
MGWAFLLKGDTISYLNAMNLVKTEGIATSEDDKNALLEAKKNYIYPVYLLKARLLCDGGFFKLADIEINKSKAFANPSLNAELLYRKAFIKEGLIDDNNALLIYNQLITTYPKVKLHYLPAACLYSGLIYEKKKLFEMSHLYFTKCLGFKGYPYYESLSSKAKSGLERIKTHVVKN